MPETIILTPNFSVVFQRFLELAQFDTTDIACNMDSAELGRARSLLVNLNIAVLSIDSIPALNEFQRQLSAMANTLAEADDSIRVGHSYVYDNDAASRHGQRVTIVCEEDRDEDGARYRVRGKHYKWSASEHQLRRAPL